MAFAVALGALLLGAACGGEPFHPARAFGPPVPPDAPRQAVEVRVPDGLGRLAVRRPDDGTVAQVACSTCHGRGPEGLAIADHGTEPANLHADLVHAHGQLACTACHDPEDRDALRLADGTRLPYEDTLTLCAQCHGLQARDWRRGAHGGMSGYWDTRRGPRVRNHCVACHDPHAPAWAPVLPVLPPRDRYFDPTADGGH